MRRNNCLYRPAVDYHGDLLARQEREINKLVKVAIEQKQRTEETVVAIREAFSGKRFVEVFRSSDRGPEEVVVAITLANDSDAFWFRAYLTKQGAINYVKKMGLCPDDRSQFFLDKSAWR